MPKRLPSALPDELLRFLASHPDGVGIEAIAGRFRPEVSKRTLQRRLTDLIASGCVMTTGEARALRYRMRHISETSVATGDDLYIPLSPVAADLRQRVGQSLAERQPVGYRREFLDDYRPNETSSLTPEVVEHLHRIGRAPGADHTAGTYARSILKRLLIDLSWASSRLEGNTYSLLETERLIELGEAAQGKEARETQMILNHKAWRSRTSTTSCG